MRLRVITVGFAQRLLYLSKIIYPRLDILVGLACALFSLPSFAGGANASDSAQAPEPDLLELWESGQTAFGQYVTGVPYTVETGRDLAANPLLDYAFLNLENTT